MILSLESFPKVIHATIIVCVCVRACVRACVCACVRACVRLVNTYEDSSSSPHKIYLYVVSLSESQSSSFALTAFLQACYTSYY